MSENIIDPIEPAVLLQELTPEIFIRPTNNAANEIYIFKGDEKPNLMQEVGRLREVTFRAAGGGKKTTNKFDICVGTTATTHTSIVYTNGNYS